MATSATKLEKNATKQKKRNREEMCKVGASVLCVALNI